MKSIVFAAAAALLACASTGAQAATLVSNLNATAQSASIGVIAQSFTLAGAGAYENIDVSFYRLSTAPVGAGKLYIFDGIYTGTAQQLATAKALGQASFANGSFSFGSDLRLAGGTTYYLYADTPYSIGLTRGNALPGGSSFLAYSVQPNGSVTQPYNSLMNDFDAQFVVNGNEVTAGPPSSGGPSPSAVPEPATWAMMLIGFGAIGGAMRRRAPNAARRVIAAR